jgi:hypothetical protein
LKDGGGSKSERRVLEFRQLLRKTNDHKFSFRRIERKQVCRHPSRDVREYRLKVKDR